MASILPAVRLGPEVDLKSKAGGTLVLALPKIEGALVLPQPARLRHARAMQVGIRRVGVFMMVA